MEHRNHARGAALIAALAALVVAAGAGAQKVDIRDYEGAITAEDLFIVDCLLPPQVRQLGQQFTYLSARRPIRTSAKECAIRGGEYVAYDLADYRTALKVWLPAAKGGDAQAQTYVGEIYEQGLGTEPDFGKAAEWYLKAAEQGHSRAMINLGALYESGRGVPKDLTQAMNLYRQASGITDGVLEYATDEELARRRALAQEAEQLRRQVVTLTAELETTRDALERRRRDLRRAREERDRTLAELEAQRLAAGAVSSADRGELERLRAENESLTTQLAAAQGDQRGLLDELRRLREQGDSAELELARTRVEIEQGQERLGRTQAEVERLKTELAGAREAGADAAEIAALQARILEQETLLDAEREAMEVREAELEAQLAEAQRRLSESQQREAELKATLDGQEQEISIIRSSLETAQAELIESQLRLADSDAEREALAELQREISERQAEIARHEDTARNLVGQLGGEATGGTSINMISPAVGLARGAKSVTLFADLSEYELIGRTAPREELLAFRVNDRDALAALDPDGIFRVPVTLSGSGQTPVSIEAVGRDGSRSEETFVIQKDVPPAVAARQTSDRFRGRLRSDLGTFHALVIGNAAYANHAALETAVNDARGVAETLRTRYGFNVRLLTDATRDQIVFELAELSQSLAGNDNLLIYYAGHGVLDAGGEGYWLGVEAAAQRDKSWIGNAQISDFISEMQARHVLVVADSCYSGTLSGAAIRPIPLEIDDQDLLFISRVRARTVLTSGGLQPVLDDGGEGHSIFGGAFIRAIQQNGDVMEGYRLFETIRREVETRSRLARVRQNPEYTALKFAGHEGSEFFFLPATTIGLVPLGRFRL